MLYVRPFLNRSILFFISLILLNGCDPMSSFKKVIIDSGHIPYANPLAHARTGTITGGSPTRMSFISAPETCFPSTDSVGGDTALRFIDQTAAPIRRHESYFEGSAIVDIKSYLEAANPAARLNINIKNTKKVHLSLQDMELEYLDAINSEIFYQEEMREICHEYLNHYGVISQVLRAGSIEFRFYKDNNIQVDFSVDNIEDFIDLEGSLNWRVINNTTLLIENPMNIGYQLSKMPQSSNGRVTERASKVRGDNYVFEKAELFQMLSR